MTENLPKYQTNISDSEILAIDAYWRATNYLSVGQIYLRDNPLLKRPLHADDIKSMLLGHWGTTPGQNFIYAHLNRFITTYDLNMIYISGPGHGGPALIANTYLEGTYSEIYPHISQDEDGLKKLFLQFSFPGGIPSHVSPECPGSIHEGGELGYSLSHSFGAVLDNPDLIVACVIGDGEAETGPLATAWHLNKLLNPVSDGVVLPILHLNGYKIANPALLARIGKEQLNALMIGYGWKPLWVEGSDPLSTHYRMVEVLNQIHSELQVIHKRARVDGVMERPLWPMIILNTPKGWTGPKWLDSFPIENTFRSHQVPIQDPKTNPTHLSLLEEWLRSYQPQDLFNESGQLRDDLQVLTPKGNRRMGANLHANGGLLLKPLVLPDPFLSAETIQQRGQMGPGDTRILARWLKDVIICNNKGRNFRLFGPDETISNGLEAVFEVTSRQWMGDKLPTDQYLSTDGRVIEVLSEHQCQGFLEGYLLTGRHGLFNCYEAFVHIVDSMLNQHAKWLTVSAKLPWRKKIASLNYLLSSHVWRQDHNGFTHQDPGFIDLLLNKKPQIVRAYFPPDGNCLLAVMKHCLRTEHLINVIVAGKHPSPQWLTFDEANKHCIKGIGVWQWASNDQTNLPDVVMACCGDVPTLETLAAVSLLRDYLPNVRVRVVNVVDLMRLLPAEEHPHGLTDREFEDIFPISVPVVFAYHGYPWLIHRLTYRRVNQHRLHVRGYKEEGTITTPFDMTVLNEMSRFHLAMDVIDRLQNVNEKAVYVKQLIKDKLIEHRQYINLHGRDLPDIVEWSWNVS